MEPIEDGLWRDITHRVTQLMFPGQPYTEAEQNLIDLSLRHLGLRESVENVVTALARARCDDS